MVHPSPQETIGNTNLQVPTQQIRLSPGQLASLFCVEKALGSERRAKGEMYIGFILRSTMPRPVFSITLETV